VKYDPAALFGLLDWKLLLLLLLLLPPWEIFL